MLLTLKRWSACLLAALLLFAAVPLAHAAAVCDYPECTQTVSVDHKDPTCTAGGRTMYTCPVHGTYEHASSVPTGHFFVDIPGTRIEPTCTQDGSVERRCDNDGCSERTVKTLPKLGHQTSSVPASPSTCTQAGTAAHYVCTREGCGALFQDQAASVPAAAADLTLPLAPHTLSHAAGEPASCTKDGLKESWTCSKCSQKFADKDGKEVLSDLVDPATGHSLESVPANPDSTPALASHWRCRVCSALFLDAEGRHPAGEADLRIPEGASLTAGGTCSRPGCTQTVQVLTRPATCTEDGLREYICPEHGRYTAENLKAGHDLWQVAEKPATTEEEGRRMHWQCRRCGAAFLDDAGLRPAGEADLALPKLDPVPVFPSGASSLTLAGGRISLKTAVEDLTAGRTYWLRATLTDAASGSALSGSGMSAALHFTAPADTYEAALQFDADPLTLRGRVLSAKLQLQDAEGTELTAADLPGNTLRIPDPALRLADLKLEDSGGTSSRVSFRAVLNCSGLISGSKCKAEVWLVDAKSGEDLREDGKVLSAELEFTAEAEGTIEVSIPAGRAALQGRTVTARAEISRTADGALLASAGYPDTGSPSLTVPEAPEPEEPEDPSVSVSGLQAEAPDDAGMIVLRGSLRYRGLEAGISYLAKGTLVDAETGREIRTADGAVAARQSFTPDAAEGSVSLTFRAPAEVLSGRRVAVQGEIVRAGDGSTVATTDPDAADMPSVSVPEVRKPQVTVSGISAGEPDENGMLEVTASLAYQGLRPGTEYLAIGTLIDAGTGSEIISGGKAVQAERTFSPEAADGTISLTFQAPAEALAGRQVTVKAEILDAKGGASIAAADPDAADLPSISIPELQEPQVSVSGISAGDLDENGMLEITATLAYQGLRPGTEYLAKGTLVDAETGSEISAGGNPIAASQAFTAEAADGSVSLTFQAPAEAVSGKQISVLGEVLRADDGVSIAATDPDAADLPSVSVPEVRKPQVTVSEINAKDPDEDGMLEITASLTYQGLRPSTEYLAKGTLIDAGTGSEISADGDSITAEQAFIPTAAGGTVSLTFHVPAAALAGRQVTVQGEIIRISNGASIAATDLDAQDAPSFTAPEVNMPAVSVSGVSAGDPAEDGTIQITAALAYEGLAAGEEYIARGTLMDAKTGTGITADGIPAAAEQHFTPASDSGTVSLIFTGPAEAVSGRSLFVQAEIVRTRDGEVLCATDSESPDAPGVQVPEQKKPSAALTDLKAEPADVGGMVRISAVISYRGLTIGTQYEASGSLVFADSGQEVLLDSRPITAREVFTPETQDGTVRLLFSAPAELVGGQKVSVQASILRLSDGRPAAQIQTGDPDVPGILVPEPEKPGVQLVKLEQLRSEDAHETVLRAELAYTGLLAGCEHLARGWLTDAESGEDIPDALSEQRFTPEESAGTVFLIFTVPEQAISGRTVSVRAEISRLDDGKVLAATDPSAEDAPVLDLPPVPSSEPAGSVSADEYAYADGQLTVSVSFAGLVPGAAYTLTATPVDMQTGEPLKSGGEVISAVLDFTPDAPEGTLRISFPVPAADFAGRDIGVHLVIRAADGTICADNAGGSDSLPAGPTWEVPADAEPSAEPSSDASPSPEPSASADPGTSGTASPDTTQKPGGTAAATGDTASLWLPLAALAAGGVTLVLLLRDRRRKVR